MFIISRNKNLTSLTTFKIGCVAKFFCVVKGTEDLNRAIDFAETNKLKTLVLGGGSNILLPEKIDGLVIKMNMREINFVDENGYVSLMVGAGEAWDDIVSKAVGKNLSGIENLSLIPGSVGAAVYQNIGAYGAELKDVLVNVKVYDIQTGKIKVMTNSDCKFGYRESIFQHDKDLVILSAKLKLNKEFKPNISYSDLQKYVSKFHDREILTLGAMRKAVIKIRKNKFLYPNQLPNAGSFFKNPVVNGKKISAAQLIEKAGWKGKRVGNVGVSDKHALVIVNYGGATAKEVIDLTSNIQKDVHKKFGIKLQPEVKIVT